MSKRDDFLLLDDMLEAADKITTYTDGLTFDEFSADSKTY